MPTLVTDQDLISQLEAPNRPPVASSPLVWGDEEAERAGLYPSRDARQPVTDPNLLRLLNSGGKRGPAERPAQFAAPTAQNFRVAREGMSEPAKEVATTEAFGRGAAQGLTANFYDELRGLMEAGGLNPNDPASLTSLIHGAYKYWTGDEQAANRYNAATARERGADRQAQEQAPIASLAGNVAGAIALPVGGALSAATLPGRIGRGAAVGGALGVAYGAGEGDGASDRASRALTGGLLGSVAGASAPPIVEGAIQGARAVAAPITTAVRGAFNPEAEASRRVATAIGRDIQADPQAVSRLRAAEFEEPARIMDLGGETTRALARSAANTSPEGRQVLNAAINDRYEGQSGRMTDWLRSTFNYPDAQAQQQAIEQAARTVNKGAYAKAYRDGARPLWDSEFRQITAAPIVQDAIRAATRTGANKAAAEGYRPPQNPFEFASDGTMTMRQGVHPTLQFWDNVKRVLDDKISAFRRSGENEAARDAQQLRTALVSHLDNLIPSYQQARAGAAMAFGAENALEAGQKFVTAKLSNAEARQALAKMSPTERQLFQDGFVSRFIEHINETGDRRNVLNAIARSPAARERLNLAMGPQKAAELEAKLRVEGIMDLARTAVQGNSTTARQLTELGFAGGAGSLGISGLYSMDPKQMTVAAVAGALLAGKRGIDTRVARHVAELLVSDDPQRLRQGLQLIARNARFMDALRSTDVRIARVGSEQSPKTAIPALQAPSASRAEDDNPSVPRPPSQ